MHGRISIGTRGSLYDRDWKGEGGGVVRIEVVNIGLHIKAPSCRGLSFILAFKSLHKDSQNY